MNIKQAQLDICAKYHSDFEQLKPDEIVAVAIDTIGKMPITGIREILEDGQNVSWYIHCGEYSKEDDFYKPVHWVHLVEDASRGVAVFGASAGLSLHHR